MITRAEQGWKLNLGLPLSRTLISLKSRHETHCLGINCLQLTFNLFNLLNFYVTWNCAIFIVRGLKHLCQRWWFLEEETVEWLKRTWRGRVGWWSSTCSTTKHWTFLVFLEDNILQDFVCLGLVPMTDRDMTSQWFRWSDFFCFVIYRTVCSYLCLCEWERERERYFVCASICFYMFMSMV